MAGTGWRLQVRAAFGEDYTDFGSYTWTDVTSDVLEVASHSGRNDQLDQFSAGRLDVVFANTDGDWTPGNTSGAYTPDIIPGLPISVRVLVSQSGGGTNDYDLFTGFVDSWDASWTGQGTVGECRASCTDPLSTLELTTINTTIASQVASDQIDDVLDEASWPAGAGARDINVSTTTLQSFRVKVVSALGVARLIADSEGGEFFAAADGRPTFRDRYWLADNSSVPVATFGDASTSEAMRGIKIVFDNDQVWNVVDVQRLYGAVQRSSKFGSIVKYGRRCLTRSGLLHTSDAESASLSDLLVGRFADPAVRVEGLSVKPSADVSTLPDVVGGLDIGDRVRVSFTPPGSGAVSYDCYVEGMTHRFDRRHEWRAGFLLSPANRFDVWILEDAVMGLLDSTTVLGW